MGVSLLDKKKIFEYVCGEKYESEMTFPFFLPDEVSCREVTISPDFLFDVGASVSFYVKTNKENHKSHWLFLHDYFFSLLPHIDKRIFNDCFVSNNLILDGARADVIRRSRLDLIMNACFKLPNPSENPEDDQERTVYLSEFRIRMDALEELVELKKFGNQ